MPARGVTSPGTGDTSPVRVTHFRSRCTGEGGVHRRPYPWSRIPDAAAPVSGVSRHSCGCTLASPAYLPTCRQGPLVTADLAALADTPGPLCSARPSRATCFPSSGQQPRHPTRRPVFHGTENQGTYGQPGVTGLRSGRRSVVFCPISDGTPSTARSGPSAATVSTRSCSEF